MLSYAKFRRNISTKPMLYFHLLLLYCRIFIYSLLDCRISVYSFYIVAFPFTPFYIVTLPLNWSSRNWHFTFFWLSVWLLCRSGYFYRSFPFIFLYMNRRFAYLSSVYLGSVGRIRLFLYGASISRGFDGKNQTKSCTCISLKLAEVRHSMQHCNFSFRSDRLCVFICISSVHFRVIDTYVFQHWSPHGPPIYSADVRASCQTRDKSQTQSLNAW